MDLDALGRACDELGLELVRGQSNWKWYGSWRDDFSAKEAAYKNGIPVETYGKNALHVIRVKGSPRAYEIGLYANPKGGKGLICVYDAWDGGKGLEAIAGKGLPKLKQHYAAEVTISHFKQQFGWKMEKNVLPNGSLQVIASR